MSSEPTRPLPAHPVTRPAGSAAASSARASPGRRWRDAQGEHLDVRGLPPPQPLVAILRLVHEQGAAGTAVIVHHDRDPVMLYPELAEIGWKAERLAGAPGHVVLQLTRLP